VLKPAEGQPITGRGHRFALIAGSLLTGAFGLLGAGCGRVGPTEVANTWVWSLRADDPEFGPLFADFVLEYAGDSDEAIDRRVGVRVPRA